MVVNAILFYSLSGSGSPALFLFYTDPGAGALLWQLLLAALVGGAFYARLLIRQVKGRIAGLKKAGAADHLSLNDDVLHK